jgi:hypothetical protein
VGVYDVTVTATDTEGHTETFTSKLSVLGVSSDVSLSSTGTNALVVIMMVFLMTLVGWRLIRRGRSKAMSFSKGLEF